MEILGKLSGEELEYIRTWCRSLKLLPITKSSYVGGRVEKWFNIGSNLQNIRLGRAKITVNEIVPDFISQWGTRFLSGWNSVLVCGGATSINWHRDHGHFEAPAVMINLGSALYTEQVYGEGEKSQHLTDGTIVKINTKLLHKSEQQSTERFHITFRTIKEQFLK